MIKACTKCGKLKWWHQFYHSKKGELSLHSICKQCFSQYNKEWRKKNKLLKKRRHKQREYHKKYYRENKERREYHKKYYRENKERIKAMSKKWSEENRERRREINKKWCEENRERRREIYKKWCEENADSYEYMKRLLFAQTGLKFCEISPEILELKREQILLHRQLKKAKEAINGNANG